jgi:hypothetical protein
LTGTISQYLSREHDKHFEYDFRLLSGAAGLIYGYTGVIPIALWAALRWFGSSTADLVECWALYGYANLMWIAVALVSWSPLTALNWALVGVGFASTVFFLLRNLYPVLTATDAKTSKMLLIAVVVLHAGLAIAIKVLFFAYVFFSGLPLFFRPILLTTFLVTVAPFRKRTTMTTMTSMTTTTRTMTRDACFSKRRVN